MSLTTPAKRRKDMSTLQTQNDAGESHPLVPKPTRPMAGRFCKCTVITILIILSIFGIHLINQQKQRKTFLVYNANIHTMDPANFGATAFVIKNGRFVDIGTDKDIFKKWHGVRSVNLQAHTVVPGLIDAHGHILLLGLTMIQPSLNTALSIAQVRARLISFVKESKNEFKDEGPWLLGWGWDQELWNPSVFPSAADLDKDPMLRDIPIVLSRRDEHALWINGRVVKLLKEKGIDLEKIENIPGGEIIKTPGVGVLLDNAMNLIKDVIPAVTEKQNRAAFSAAIQLLHSVGLTSVHDAGVLPEDISFFRKLHADGKFNIRSYIMVTCPQQAEFCGDKMEQFHTTDGMLKLSSVKLFMDGAVGSWGAAMLEPYDDAPNKTGILRLDPSILNDLVGRWLDAGYQVNTHCIGDRANRLILDAYEYNLRKRFGEDPERLRTNGLRLRIEHAQIVAPDDFKRAGKLGIIPSMQPTHATSDMSYVEQRLGNRTKTEAYAWRTFLDNGVPAFPLSSDFPIEHPSPLAGFYAAVTRKYPDGTSPHGPDGWFPTQKLTREEALRGFTIDAAYSAFMEEEVGSISVGKYADFVVMSQDIMDVPEDDILDINIKATVIGGDVVFGDLVV